MVKLGLLGAVCVTAVTLLSTIVDAVVLPLEGRLETAVGSGVFLAHYDPNLDITWTARANLNGRGSSWDDNVAGLFARRCPRRGSPVR